MKVLIQNSRSGEYLTQNGTWSPLPSHGRDFRYSSCARDVMRRENVSDFRVLFYFEEFDYFIRARRTYLKRSSPELCSSGLDF